MVLEGLPAELSELQRSATNAFDDFLARANQIKSEFDQQLQLIEAKKEEVLQQTWEENVALVAEFIMFDGFSMAELYPKCVISIKNAP